MISLRLRIFIIILLVLVLAFIINMVRKRALELKYVLAWLLCDFALLIFTCFPKTMTIIKNFLGIKTTANMIFFLGFLFSLIIIFSLTVALSRVTAKVRRLTQKMALEIEEQQLKDAEK